MGMTTSTASSVSFLRVRSISNMMIRASYYLFHRNPSVQYVVDQIVRYRVNRIVLHFCGGGVQKDKTTRLDRLFVPSRLPWRKIVPIRGKWMPVAIHSRMK